MRAINDEITITSGDDVILVFPVHDCRGNPVDPTDFDLVWALFPEGAIPGDYVVLKDNAGTGGLATDESAAQCTVSLSQSDTEALEGAFFYQLRGVSPAGARQMMATGPVVIEEDKLLLPA